MTFEEWADQTGYFSEVDVMMESMGNKLWQAATAAERERCAAECDDRAQSHDSAGCKGTTKTVIDEWRREAEFCAAAIREADDE